MTSARSGSPPASWQVRRQRGKRLAGYRPLCTPSRRGGGGSPFRGFINPVLRSALSQSVQPIAPAPNVPFSFFRCTGLWKSGMAQYCGGGVLSFEQTSYVEPSYAATIRSTYCCAVHPRLRAVQTLASASGPTVPMTLIKRVQVHGAWPVVLSLAAFAGRGAGAGSKLRPNARAHTPSGMVWA